MGVSVRARLLGDFELSIGGRAVDRSAFERPSGLRLLKLLLATPGHRVRREAAAELLWPEMDPDRSAGNLRKALHFARRAVEAAGGPPGLLDADGEWLRIGSPAAAMAAPSLEVDVDALRAVIERVRGRRGSSEHAGDTQADADLERLVALGGRDLLPEDPYEEWLTPLRERLRQQSLEALLDGARFARALGRSEVAMRLLERALALEPAEESAHRQAIELHLEAGRLHAARRQLLDCARALDEAYGIEPSPELAQLIAAAAAARVESAVTREPAIVGRRLELETADPVLDRVAGGQLGALVFRGPPGIGKTRVLREVVRLGQASGWRAAVVRGLESSPGLAFGALGGGLGAVLGGRLPDSVREPGRSGLLAIVPGLAGRPAMSFATDAALQAALIDALAGLAREAPLILAVDDVQWLDGSTVELLLSVASRLTSVPILLVAAVRDAPDPLSRPVSDLLRAAEAGGGRVVALGPVAPREIHLILERDLPSGRLDEHLSASIAQRVDGAPLFALEVLRAGIDAGVIVQRGETWRAAGNDSLPVPAGVARMVEARTARLPAPIRETLAMAAELGDAVTLEVLVAATARPTPIPSSPPVDARVLDSGPVLEVLEAGLNGGLLVERDGRYAFAHPLFRSALRAAVLPGTRADLHERVATALAGGIDPTDAAGVQAAGRGGRDVVGVARHAFEAAELGRASAIPLAIGFGFAAGAREAAVFDHASSTRTLERALGLWERLPGGEQVRYPAADAYLQLGWSRHATRDEVGAADAFRRAAAVAATEGQRARAWQAAAWMPYEHGRFDAADDVLREAIAGLRDPVARAALASDRAWILGRKGGWAQAYEVLVEAVRVIEGSGDSPLLARSLDRLGVAMRDAIDAEASIPILERAIRLAREIDDSRLEATARMHLAGALRSAGRYDAASKEIETALRTCSMTGDRYIEAVTVWIAADIAHARGDLRGAVSLRRRELELLHELGGNEHNQAMAHAHLAFLHRSLGDAAAASVEADLARAVAQHSGLPHLPARIEDALSATAWFSVDGQVSATWSTDATRRRSRGASVADAGAG